MIFSIRSKIHKLIVTVLAFLLAWLMSLSAFAAEATTFFGSEKYDTFVGDEFPIGIYINSAVNIGSYELEVRYDNDRLEYLYGAINEKDGVLYISGDINDTGTRTMVSFRAIGGGEAGITIVSAKAKLPNSDEEFDITELAYAPIHIAGEDTVGETFKERINREKEETIKAEEEARLQAEKEAAEKEAAEKEAAEKEAAEKEAANEENQVNNPDEKESIPILGDEELTAEEIAEAADIKESVSSAREIYEQSKMQTTPINNRLSKMAISLALIIMLVIALIVTTLVGIIRKSRLNKMIEAENRKEKFSFDFDSLDKKSRKRF